MYVVPVLGKGGRAMTDLCVDCVHGPGGVMRCEWWTGKETWRAPENSVLVCDEFVRAAARAVRKVRKRRENGAEVVIVHLNVCWYCDYWDGGREWCEWHCTPCEYDGEACMWFSYYGRMWEREPGSITMCGWDGVNGEGEGEQDG